MFQHDKNRIKWLVGILLAAFILLLVIAGKTGVTNRRLTGVERGLRDFLAPLQSGATAVYEALRVIPEYFAGIQALQEENAALEKQLDDLQAQYDALVEVEAENQRLTNLLGVYEDYKEEWEPVTVPVTGRNASTWYQTITIRGGENRGFTPDLPVINGDGLVGRILNVSKYSSEVLLLLDNNAAAACLVQNTRTPGVIQASDNETGMLELIHVPYDSPIEPYQTIVTSGLGGVYPKGLRIGFITEIDEEPGGLMLSAQVEPFVDFDRLEEVMVLLPRVTRGDDID